MSPVRPSSVVLLALASACSNDAGGGGDGGARPTVCRSYAMQYSVTSIEATELGQCAFDRPSLTMTCRRFSAAPYDQLTTWDTLDAAVSDNHPLGWSTRSLDTLVLSSDCSVRHDYVYDSSGRLIATEASTTGDSCGGPNVEYDAWDVLGRPTRGTTNGIGLLECMGQDLAVSYDDATSTVTAAYSGGTSCRDETISLTYDADGIVTSSAYSVDGGITSVVSTFVTEERGEICTD